MSQLSPVVQSSLRLRRQGKQLEHTTHPTHPPHPTHTNSPKLKMKKFGVDQKTKVGGGQQEDEEWHEEEEDTVIIVKHIKKVIAT